MAFYQSETIQVNPEQLDVITEECENLEKNMRNIFGHAIFAAAISAKMNLATA